MYFWQPVRRAFAEEVTAALHAVHACTGEAFGDTMHPDCAGWLQYYRPFAEAVLEQAEAMHAAGRLPGKVMAAMRAAWARFDDIFCEEVTKPCLIHGDLNIANILVGKGVTFEVGTLKVHVVEPSEPVALSGTRMNIAPVSNSRSAPQTQRFFTCRFTSRRRLLQNR